MSRYLNLKRLGVTGIIGGSVVSVVSGYNFFYRVDHNHPNGFGAWDRGRLVDVVVEQDGEFYQVRSCV